MERITWIEHMSNEEGETKFVLGLNISERHLSFLEYIKRKEVPEYFILIESTEGKRDREEQCIIYIVRL